MQSALERQALESHSCDGASDCVLKLFRPCFESCVLPAFTILCVCLCFWEWIKWIPSWHVPPQVSVNKVRELPVTQAEDCQVGFEVLQETSSQEHKFKLLSAVATAKRGGRRIMREKGGGALASSLLKGTNTDGPGSHEGQTGSSGIRGRIR